MRQTRTVTSFRWITPLNNAGIVVPQSGVAVAATLFFQECSMCKANESRGEQVFGPKGPSCQSCGMPLSKNKKGRHGNKWKQIDGLL